MYKNNDLTKARNAKKDEFYTELTDIEKELKHYKEHFKDKIVFCNCDDPFESNFFKYFILNFNYLGLKKLISTSYAESSMAYKQITLDEILGHKEAESKPPYKAVVTQVPDNSNYSMPEKIKELLTLDGNYLSVLKENGDFRSAECIELLEEADIVVTNPPFSLFRQFMATLVSYNKQFLIIGNMNAETYTDIFPLIMENKMWIGPSIHSGDRKFFVPDDYPLKASGCGTDPDGRRYIRVKGIRWYTNLDMKERHEDIILVKKYDPAEYCEFENLKGCINVDKVINIPMDYSGLMGVPITFLDKYNPDQFEIIGCADANILPPGWKGAPASFVKLYYEQGNTGQYTEGNRLACYITHDGQAKIPYKRVIVRLKNPQKNS